MRPSRIVAAFATLASTVALAQTYNVASMRVCWNHETPDGKKATLVRCENVQVRPSVSGRGKQGGEGSCTKAGPGGKVTCQVSFDAAAVGAAR